VKVNGEAVPVEARPGAYLRLSRAWRDGDTVTLALPMRVRLRRWAANADSVSVDYGPLTFSLAIEERYEKRDSRATAQVRARWQPGADADRWPSYEIYPDSPWNYGLQLEGEDPAGALSVVRREWPADDHPFTLAASPLEIRARGRRVPGWGIDEYGLTGVLPESPVATTEPVTELRLVPMGGARLRISAFPTVA
jgi:hypothetical protein